MKSFILSLIIICLISSSFATLLKRRKSHSHFFNRKGIMLQGIKIARSDNLKAILDIRDVELYDTKLNELLLALNLKETEENQKIIDSWIKTNQIKEKNWINLEIPLYQTMETVENLPHKNPENSLDITFARGDEKFIIALRFKTKEEKIKFAKDISETKEKEVFLLSKIVFKTTSKLMISPQEAISNPEGEPLNPQDKNIIRAGMYRQLPRKIILSQINILRTRTYLLSLDLFDFLAEIFKGILELTTAGDGEINKYIIILSNTFYKEENGIKTYLYKPIQEPQAPKILKNVEFWSNALLNAILEEANKAINVKDNNLTEEKAYTINSYATILGGYLENLKSFKVNRKMVLEIITKIEERTQVDEFSQGLKDALMEDINSKFQKNRKIK